MGTEFQKIVSPDFKRQWELDVYRTHVDNVKKNSVTEIANKLLENRIYKAINARKDYEWTSFLDEIVLGINNLKRDVLFGFSSAQVKFDKNIESIVKKKFMLKLDKFQKPFRSRQPKFSPGQSVRLVKKSHIFQRGYMAKTGEKTETIKEVKSTAPYMYTLENKQRPYYEAELIPYIEDGKDKRDEKFNYYISEEKPIIRRHLRSGQSRAGLPEEKLFRLRKRDNPKFDNWIDFSERQKLIDDGKLPLLPFEK